MYKSVRPSSILKKRFGHLSSLSKSDLTRICRELTERFAMNWMQGMQNTNKQKRNLDEVFFERETNMHETNARAQKSTQENFI